LKVGVFLNDISPLLGGNFSYYEKFIRHIDQYHFDERISICFVGRIGQNKVNFKKEYIKISPWFFFKIFEILQNIFSRFSINIDLVSKIDAKILRKHKVDLLLFPKQFLRQVDNFPFISLNWDAGHKSTFMFPEFAEDYDKREKWHRYEVQKAMALFVESESSKQEFSAFFSIPEIKIEVVPLFPGGVIELNLDDKLQAGILDKFALKRGSYFYYPAQFWAHKNHYNLILAFKQLMDSAQLPEIKLVLSGSDKGNKSYILSMIKDLRLERNVLVLGFISNEEVYALYKGAVALVMPTFLGPTNMPLLEAQNLQTAIICSDLKGHREMCSDGALYVDPADPSQWCEAMRRILQPDFRETLIRRADAVRKTSMFNIETAIHKLERALLKIIPIRKTFR
jgi:glycosyltransferase involved in cell wall biosynthesis